MRLCKLRCGFERPPARMFRIREVDLSGIEPLGETAMQCRESCPRRAAARVELDGSDELRAARFQPPLHHSGEMRPSVQEAVRRLLALAVAAPGGMGSSSLCCGC